MSEITDRAGKALYEISVKGWSSSPIKEHDLNDFVRAVIQAMREPTKEMLKAGAEGSGEDSEAVAGGAWRAMIDAALK